MSGGLEDRQAIEAILNEFVQAAATGDLPARLFTGQVADAFATASEASRFAQASQPSGEFVVQRLNIESIEGDTARVEFRALALTVLDHPVLGERRIRTTYSGPVLLRRQRGSWRILTLKINGIDMASALFRPASAELDVNGFHVAVTSWIVRHGHAMAVVIRNDREQAVSVERVSVGSVFWRLFEDAALLRRRPLFLRPGDKWGRTARGKGHIFAAPSFVRLCVDGQDLELQLEPPKLSFGRRLLQTVNNNTLFHGMALLSLVAAIWVASAVFAFVLLLAGAMLVAGEILSLLGGVRVVAQPVYMLTGVVEIGGASFLLHRENVDRLTIGLVAFGFLATLIPQFQLVFHNRRAER